MIKINIQKPFKLVAVDLLQLPKSTIGYNYAFILIDHFSKWVAVVLIKNKHTSLVTTAFNAREFRGPEFRDFLKFHQIHHIYMTPYSPASNGITERVNKTLIQYLHLSLNNPLDWDLQLPQVALPYYH